MNIRKKVVFSFIILILFMISISLLTLITTYQMKGNTAFAKQVTKLINIQEDMNELINLVTEENSNPGIISAFKGREAGFSTEIF